jgi:hypothetical protein
MTGMKGYYAQKARANRLGAQLTKVTRERDDLRERVDSHVQELGLQAARIAELEHHLKFLADQDCLKHAEGSADDLSCTETGACLTEICPSCYAKRVLSSDPKDARYLTTEWAETEDNEDNEDKPRTEELADGLTELSRTVYKFSNAAITAIERVPLRSLDTAEEDLVTAVAELDALKSETDKLLEKVGVDELGDIPSEVLPSYGW